MTLIRKSDNPLSITSNGIWELGGVGRGLGIVAVGLLCGAWSTTTIKVMGRVRGCDAEADYRYIDYFPRNLNDAPSDSSPVSTSITDDSLIQVDVSALDLALEVTNYGGTPVDCTYAKS